MSEFETKILSAVGIYRGVVNTDKSYFQVVGEDETGRQYVMTFGCKTRYKEAMEKYFGKLNPILAPKQEVKLTDILIVKEPKVEEDTDGKDNS